MSELKFSRGNNEKYNTISINTEDAMIPIKEEDYNIISIEKTKFGDQKAIIKLNNQDLIDKLKSWETEINEYLKNEVGTGPITVLYGNRIYPKRITMIGQKKKEYHIRINGVWINENNKPFVQVWYVRYTN